MTTHTTRHSGNTLLARFGGLITSIPFARQILSRWVKNHDARIIAGAGAGLRFNIAGTTPAYISGKNELPVQDALARRLKPGDVFYDIGANIGFFSVIAARLVGPTGQVIAFEPLPDNAAAIKHNAAINRFSNLQVMEVAVSNTTGQGEIYLADWKGGAALATTAELPPDVKGSMTIDLIAVDDLLEQGRLVPPTCIKIDVEGAEIDVLRGMVKTLHAYHPILVYEIDDHDHAAYAHKQSLCEEFLKTCGYRLTRLEDSYPSPEWIVGHYLAE